MNDDAPFDALNRALERVEQALGRVCFGIGVGALAEVQLPCGTKLRFLPKSKRLLFFRVGEPGILFRGASLVERCEAVEALPALLEALEEASEAQLQRVLDATHAANEFAEALEQDSAQESK